MSKKFQIACIQSSIEVIDDPARKDDVIARNLRRGLDIAEAAVVRDEARVVVFPEAWLQGFNHKRTPDDWKAVCIEIPGPETDVIGRSRGSTRSTWREPPSNGTRLARGVVHNGFIAGPSGTVELRYRKCHEHNVEGLIPSVCPADVYTEYVRRYGEDSLFPVLDTPYGRLATIVEHDVNFFELSPRPHLSRRGDPVASPPPRPTDPWPRRATRCAGRAPTRTSCTWPPPTLRAERPVQRGAGHARHHHGRQLPRPRRRPHRRRGRIRAGLDHRSRPAAQTAAPRCS